MNDKPFSLTTSTADLDEVRKAILEAPQPPLTLPVEVEIIPVPAAAHERLGRVAYEAAMCQRWYTSLVRDLLFIEPWESLPKDQKASWCAIAGAVMNETVGALALAAHKAVKVQQSRRGGRKTGRRR